MAEADSEFVATWLGGLDVVPDRTNQLTVLEVREPVEVAPGRVVVEVVYQAAADDEEPVDLTLFVELSEQGDSWKVVEIQ